MPRDQRQPRNALARDRQIGAALPFMNPKRATGQDRGAVGHLDTEARVTASRRMLVTQLAFLALVVAWVVLVLL